MDASFTFQLTSSHGGWRNLLSVNRRYSFFNSHPHKKDDAHICTTFPKNMFFNSHPHKEDDHSWRYQQNHNMFSTHILTRRMTCHNVCDIFKHFFFNSHPHKEDDAVKAVSAPTVAFSTHILTRRMTIKFLYRNDHIAFQLTSSQGGWRLLLIHLSNMYFFNSHPHKEDDNGVQKWQMNR